MLRRGVWAIRGVTKRSETTLSASVIRIIGTFSQFPIRLIRYIQSTTSLVRRALDAFWCSIQ